MRVIVKTGGTEDFFKRARKAARKADQGEVFDTPTMTLSFGDPDRMFSVLSDTRRRLMHEIMAAPKSLNDLAITLNRPRSSVTKDVRLLEETGLVISERVPNPGHGVYKVVKAIAPRIELVASLG